MPLEPDLGPPKPNEGRMLSHLTIGTSDFAAAWAFYEPLMAELGWTLRFHDRQRPWAVWGGVDGARPFLIVTTPIDENPATAGNGAMTAFRVADAAAVLRAHVLALGLGGRDEGAPGPRPEYHGGFYGAYARDPDGNKLCFCTHEWKPA